MSIFFSLFFPEALLWLCLLPTSLKNECPEQEPFHQGRGTVPSTYPREGACALLFLCFLH